MKKIMHKNDKIESAGLALFVAYSLFFGFIAMSLSRLVNSKLTETDIWFVPYFSLTNICVFFVAAIILFVLLYVFVLQNSLSPKISKVLSEILYNPIVFVMLAVVCFRLWYDSNFLSHTVWYDTATYANYNYNIFLGEVDKFRTPVYPWFLKLIGFVTHTESGSDAFYFNIANAQKMISLIGTVIFYYTAKKMFKNKFVICAATILFGTTPAIISWNFSILTECLSIFAATLCLYLIMSYLNKPSYALAAVLSIYAFVMVMLRPTFVYMFAIFGVFWVARLIFTKYDRKRALCGIIALCVSGAMLLGYCGLNKKQNDCFATSSVGVSVNQLYMVIDQNIYENSKYPEITSFINEKMSSGNTDINLVIDVIEPANNQFSYSEIAAYVKDCIADNKDVFNQYTLNKFSEVLNTKITIQYASMSAASQFGFKTADDVLMNLTCPFTYGSCFALVVIAVIFAIYQLIRRKVLLWQIIGLCSIIFAHLFASVYASMAEYERLAVMAIPSMLLLVFWFVDLAVSQTDSRRHNNEMMSRGDRLMALACTGTAATAMVSEPEKEYCYDDEFEPDTANINESDKMI